ncbi:hypothetical protein RclHR1_15340003 [Rhizophagus clarus]|uniref:Protein kinase domain-containing protein n=1 Tax=Rhizophagus clarus TaxID=94130 RepID=A0A2Z6QGM8_9GLOM|nr:hypothetical protein RclHR1_15340003 [Rhizophagus clarus]
MSENIESTLNYYEKALLNQEYGVCSDCNQLNTHYNWCQSCNSKRFQQDFNKWTSGNEFMDKFIQDAQLKARNHYEAIEWIPYNRLRNIKYLAEGSGFSIVYKAILLDGYIEKLDSENQQWIRSFYKLEDEDYEHAKHENIKSPLNKNEKNGLSVVIKSLNNSSNINDNFLNEKNYLNFISSAKSSNSFSIPIYGITQDPETSNYIIVMHYMSLGSLRSNLMIKKYNLHDKYSNLSEVASSLSALHNCNLVHGDFHSGNLLLQHHRSVFISDLGLSQPVDKPIESNEIYGVLPYIAPEVLRGNPYTKAADIYSFGIIMWEMTSGIPAFNNIPHDFDLSLDIWQGLRPDTVISMEFPNDDEQDTEVEYLELMKRCWDSDPDKRPVADEIDKSFDLWKNKHPYDDDERVLVPGKQ